MEVFDDKKKQFFPPFLSDTELVEVPGKCPKHFFNCLQPKFPPWAGCIYYVVSVIDSVNLCISTKKNLNIYTFGSGQL